jgi:hypothetical protein
MMNRLLGIVALVLVALGLVDSKTAYAQDAQLTVREQPTWRWEMGNDALFDSDNQFTNGFTIQKHSTVSSNMDDLAGVRTFGKRLAGRLLPQDSDLVYRKGIVVGQNMATPDELENPNIILDDTPYFGMLAAQGSWIAFNDTRLTGLALTLGIVGEYSFADAVQEGVHSLIDATEPLGWEHQLDTEPVVNFHYMKKRKLWNKPSFDGAFNVDVAVGNFLTGIDAGMEMRFGRKPGGFSYVPDPIGRGMAFDATLPRKDNQADIYGTLTVRAWAWAVFMPLEGNTFVDDNEWTENNTIEPENVIGQAIVGFHYVKPKWGLHATWTFATDNVDEDSLRPGIEVENSFGTLMFEWRFDG